VHPLIEAILRFIQLRVPLQPLKPTAQSRRGVLKLMKTFEPSALRAAKATEFE
jgi:hypothetical protein